MNVVCLFGTLGDVSLSPFAPRSKMNPAIVAAGLTAGGSLLGNLLGFGSSSSANKTNYEIAQMNAELQRETNAQAYKMFQEQNEWNLDMWNKQNEYNDPSRQVERLKAAGINPAAVFGNGSVSQASQLQSATAPQLRAPQLDARMNPYQPDFQVGQAVNAYMQARLMHSQVESSDVDTGLKRIELSFKVQKEIGDLFEQRARVTNILSSSKLSDSQRELYSSQLRDLNNRIHLFEDTFDSLKEREKLTNDVLSQQAHNLIADTALKRITGQFQSLVNQFYPQMQQAQLDKIGYECQQIIQNTELLVREGVLTGKKAVSEHLQNELLQLQVNDQTIKHGIRHGENKATETLYYFSDYISDLIFGNLKLFGK